MELASAADLRPQLRSQAKGAARASALSAFVAVVSVRRFRSRLRLGERGQIGQVGSLDLGSEVRAEILEGRDRRGRAAEPVAEQFEGALLEFGGVVEPV